MRKSFLTKAIVAVGVMASAMALSSMAVFAAIAASDISSETKSSGAIISDTSSYSVIWDLTGLENNKNAQTLEATKKPTGTTYTLSVLGTDGNSNGATAKTISGYNYNKAFKLQGDTISITTLNDNETIVIDWIGGNTTRTIEITGADTGTVSSSSSNGTNGVQTSLALGKAGTYNFTSSSNIYIGAIGIVDAVASSVTYNWIEPSLPSGISGTLSWEKSTGTSNTLIYEGTGYSLKSTYSAWSISSANATVVSTGEDTYSVSISPESSWFQREALVIDAPAFMSSNIVTSEDLADKSVIADYFVISNSEGGEIKLDNESLISPSYGGFDYTQSISTGGSGNINKRAIKFTTGGSTYIQVVAASNSSTGSRFINISDGTNDVEEVGLTSKTPVAVNYYASKAGTYYVYPDASIHILSIAVVPCKGLTDATNGKSFAETTDTYIIAKIPSTLVGEENVSLNIGDGTYNEPITNVYKQVRIDNVVFTASDFDTGYLYAVKITGANGKAANVFTVVQE